MASIQPAQSKQWPRAAWVGAIMLLAMGASILPIVIPLPLRTPANDARTTAISTTATGDLAYVTLANSDLVALVDTASHAVVGSVDVGAAGCNFPWQATISPDGSYVYVGCRDSGNVTVIETAGNTVVTTVAGIPNAEGIAFSRDSAYALVGSRGVPQIAVMNTATYLMTFISTPAIPHSIVAHPYLDRAYATCADGTILVIDTTNFSIITAIPVGGDPWDVAISPDGRWVFAVDRWGAGLAVIDANNNTVYTTITDLGNLTGLEVAPDGSEVYACGLESGVHVIDGSIFNHITTVPGVGTAWEAAVTCDGTELYVGDASEEIPVINTATNSVILKIIMPGYTASDIAICPQHVASGVVFSPPAQVNNGAVGGVVTYQETLVNVTGVTDSFNLTLGSHAWGTALSADSLGPVVNGGSVTFTVHVTVPAGVAWYSTDTVVVTATSVTSPTVYSDTANFTTQAYAPPQISVTPHVLTSTQYVHEIVHETVTISNGNGVTLTFQLMTPSTLPVQDGLISWWAGDGDAADSADDNDGTLQGGTGFAPGKVGQAFHLDGLDDRVNVGNAPNLHVSDDEFTILAWVKFDTDEIWPMGDDMSIADKMSSNGVNTDGWRLLRQVYQNRFWFCLGRGSTNGCGWGAPTTVMATTVAQKDVWYHVAGVLGSCDFSIYVNGVMEDSKPRPTFTDSNHADLLIGSYVLQGSYLDGFVDEVALFDRALTEAQIQALYHWESGGKVPWLAMDPISGTVATDSETPLQVTLDATSLQPNTYSTQIAIQSNDPISSLVSIPVTITVLPTANMGWVEGTVTDAETGDPLEATISALGQPYAITPDPDTGSYVFWLDEGRYTLQARAEGYATEMAVVDVVAQRGTSHDFTLKHYQMFLPLIMRNTN